MSRVLLVNLPFFHLRWPNLGLGLLKAGLRRAGVPCDVAYWNFDFAERVGEDVYAWLAECFGFVLGGDRLFARHYFGHQLPDDQSYCREVLVEADPELTDDDFRLFLDVQRKVPEFVEELAERVDWSRYAVVGFTTSFQQTLASLCLARRIKQRAPGVVVVFGGSACDGPMGPELLRRFPEIDYVCVGEADETFPELVWRVLEGRSPVGLPGVVGRDELLRDADSQAAGECPAVAPSLVGDLNSLPLPDFDDYFQRVRTSPVAPADPLLFFETARGCWWGQKHHCAFCGLNGSTLQYRSKSAERALAELAELVRRYGVRRACAADNVFDFRYFRTLVPLLKRAGLEVKFIYECKTNVSREQVQALVEAGLGGVQLGVETFSTPLLRQIHKGATALQNIQALKWFTEAGLEVEWNLLYGFPNEEPLEYQRMADLLPSLVHLAPPLSVGRVRPDRFSPYFEAPERYGLVRLRPHRAFRFVFPFPESSLRRLAYYFEFDYADGRNPLSYAAPVVEAARTWQQLAGHVTLRYVDRPDGTLLIHDTRPGAAQFQTLLTGLEREVYRFCDTGRTLRSIQSFLSRRSEQLDTDRLNHFLQRMLEQRLMVRVDDHYLSLALRS